MQIYSTPEELGACCWGMPGMVAAGWSGKRNGKR